MKDIDYSKLLFAAEVHKLAMSRYNAAYDRVASSPKATAASMREWEKEHPFSTFERGALGSFLSTAATIDEHIEAEQQRVKRTTGA